MRGRSPWCSCQNHDKNSACLLSRIAFLGQTQLICIMAALKKIDPRKYLFAVEYCKNGGNASKAVAVIHPELARQSLYNVGVGMLEDAETLDAIDMVWEERKRNAPLTIDDKRRFLSQVVNTPLVEVDEYSLLAKKVTRKIRRDENGETETTVVEMVDKLQALDMDSKLAGHYAPTVHISGGSADVGNMLSRIMGIQQAPTLDVESELVHHHDALQEEQESDDDWL